MMPRLINTVSEQEARGGNAIDKATARRELVVLETSQASSRDAAASQDTKVEADAKFPQATATKVSFSAHSNLAELPASTVSAQATEMAPPLPLRRPSMITAAIGVKVIKSSLTPTARTKFTLGRVGKSASRSKRLRKARASSIGRLSQQRQVSKHSVWFGSQSNPAWAKEAFVAGGDGGY